MQKYQPTIRIFSDSEFGKLKAGQWIVNSAGSRGQYLGITRQGVVVIRWQPGIFGAKRDTRNNANLRRYAKDYGSK